LNKKNRVDKEKMNCGTITDSHYACFTSNGMRTTRGKYGDMYTFQDTFTQDFAQDHSCWSMQPLTFHLTHSFENITEHNNKLVQQDVVTGEAELMVLPPGQYDIESFVAALTVMFNQHYSDAGEYEVVYDSSTRRIQIKSPLAAWTIGRRIIPIGTVDGADFGSTLLIPMGYEPTRALTLGSDMDFLNIAAYEPNLRGPECVWVSLAGLRGATNSISNSQILNDEPVQLTSVDWVFSGKPARTSNRGNLHKAREGIDDTNLFLYVPVNCEYGGTIHCRFHDTWGNSVIMNNLQGELTNRLTITLYDHQKRVLYLKPNQTCSLLMKQHQRPGLN